MVLFGARVDGSPEWEDYYGKVEGRLSESRNQSYYAKEGDNFYFLYRAHVELPDFLYYMCPLIFFGMVLLFGFNIWQLTILLPLGVYFGGTSYFWFYIAKMGARMRGYKGLFEKVKQEEVEAMIWNK